MVDFFDVVPIEERASIGQELMFSSRKSTISPQTQHLRRAMSVKMADITGTLANKHNY